MFARLSLYYFMQKETDGVRILLLIFLLAESLCVMAIAFQTVQAMQSKPTPFGELRVLEGA